jgi:sarcosine oxidase subunit beta
MHCDVVVIGAGAVGCSAAFQMAEAGLKVVLVEKGFPGMGTSRATQAGIGIYAKRPGANLLINMKGGELYPGLVARLGCDVELDFCGVVNVGMNDDEMQKMRVFVARQHETPGYKADMLTGDEARAMEPALSREVAGAAFCPLDGAVNPLLYVQALARGFLKRGGQMLAWTEVHGITRTADHVWSVATSRGQIEAAWVVICAGIDARRIGAMIGIEIPIDPNRGHVLVTEAIPPLIRRRISGPTLIRQTAHGNLLLGQSEELVGHDQDMSLPALAAQAVVSRRVLPSLEWVKVIRSFIGFRPWPPDGLPILGEVPGAPGFLVGVGHSGVTWSPAAGRLLTELVNSAPLSLPLEPYSLVRFTKAATEARPVATLPSV